MFIVGTTGDDVNEYTLSTGFDLTSTVTFVDSYSVSPKEAQPNGSEVLMQMAQKCLLLGWQVIIS